MYVRLILAASFLFWVGYHWPAHEIEIRAKGATAGVVELMDEPQWRFPWSDLGRFHPDFWPLLFEGGAG